MYRTLEADLRQWAKSKTRMPLLLRGARQVGKTYLVEKLGKDLFDQVISINFESPKLNKQIFSTLDADKIVKYLEVTHKVKITPGNTLLFFDEIQDCPDAIKSLRYFKENIPNLHVIGAGSLLEFALEDGEFSFPVGRVEYRYLKPLSFTEFLINLEEQQLLDALNEVTLQAPLMAGLHEHALELVRLYMLVGGMPAVVANYIENKSLLETHKIQSFLIESYRNDFGKYATRTTHKHLQQIFSKCPFLIGKQVKFVNIDSETKSRELKDALHKCIQAGLFYPINATTAYGLPLAAEEKDNIFKLLFLDIGLLQNFIGIDAEDVFTNNVMQINNGCLAEQFVGQEILAYAKPYENTKLNYWQRNKKNSTAELDYLISIGSKIIPIEVKAGKTGTLKSLHSFMKNSACEVGVKISQHELSLDQNVLSVPFYLISQLQNLLSEVPTTK